MNRFGCKALIVAIAVFCVVGISGCGSSNEIEPIGVDVLSQLVVGQTTRVETIALLGQPDWVSSGDEGQNEVLCYESDRFKQSALHSMLRRLSFQSPENCSAVNLAFDESNVLSEITMRD